MAGSFRAWVFGSNYNFRKSSKQLKKPKHTKVETFKYGILEGWMGEVSAKSVNMVHLIIRGDPK